MRGCTHYGSGKVSIATFQQLALNTLWRSGHLTELQTVGLQEKSRGKVTAGQGGHF